MEARVEVVAHRAYTATERGDGQRDRPGGDRPRPPPLEPTNDSWRVDETYIKVRGKWLYLYRALDSAGNTLDFLLNVPRSRRAGRRFFRNVLGGSHITPPRVMNVDKNPTTIGAMRDLKREKLLTESCKRRPSQYMNNIIELGSSLPETPDPAGTGFLFLPDCLADDTRIRGDAHDSERAGAGSREAKYQSSESVNCRIVWISRLNRNDIRAPLHLPALSQQNLWRQLRADP